MINWKALLPYDVRCVITIYLSGNEELFPVDDYKKYITELTLHKHNMPEQCSEVFSNLRVLYFTTNFATMKVDCDLLHVPDLEKLYCGNTSGITVKWLKSLKNLKTLDCGLCCYSNDALNSLHQLEEINVGRMLPHRITSLTKLKHLKKIVCSNRASSCGLLDLQYFPELLELDCGAFRILNGFRSTPKLKKLVCNYADIHGSDFSQLENLEELDCRRHNFPDTILSFLPNLKRLYCYSCEPSNNEPTNRGLINLKNLEVLEMSSSMTSDCLQYVPKLKELHYSSSNRISNADFLCVPELKVLEYIMTDYTTEYGLHRQFRPSTVTI